MYTRICMYISIYISISLFIDTYIYIELHIHEEIHSTYFQMCNFTSVIMYASAGTVVVRDEGV